MSERDINRVEVLNEVQSVRRTVAAAASVSSISERQAYRLLARYQENGGFELVHKARGRTSNRSHNPGVWKCALGTEHRDPVRELQPDQRPRGASHPHTAQDRLVKELRLAGVNDVQAGDAFLPAFVKRFKQRFSGRAARPENLHRKLNVAPSRLKDILCHREQRYVSAQLTISYDRTQIILELKP